METLLARESAMLDGAYYCPHAPDLDPPCDCRKPAIGLYLRAAEEHDVDLAASYYIGDRMRDVLPGAALGGRGFLVRGTETFDEAALPARVRPVDTLAEATELLLAERV
jgi:histidinol phosphatase-like enzyme